MTIQFSPYERYFDKDGRPTGIGQQLFLRLNQLFAAQDASLALTNTALGATNTALVGTQGALAATQANVTGTKADVVALTVTVAGLTAGGAGITSKQAAAVILAGQMVRPNASGQLVLAQADSPNNAKAAIIASSGAAIGFTANLAAGFLTLADWTNSTGGTALVVGARYFLSPTTAGRITTTPPTTSGQVVLMVGFALDTLTLSLEDSSAIIL